MQKDIRTIDKIVNGNNETYNDNNMWLCPFQKDTFNQIFLFFDKPIVISAIKFWNYSKTPSRGCFEIEISIDEVLIYKGYLNKAPN
jgi:hypothetical protein